MKQLDTSDLNKSLQIEGYLGSHAFNELPPKPEGDFSLVINVTTGPGSHWLALVRKKKRFIFLDSFGRPINGVLFSREFKETMKKCIDGPLTYNRKWVQDLTSNACGYYCVFFLKQLQSLKLNNILESFGDDLKKNDKFVYEFYVNNK